MRTMAAIQAEPNNALTRNLATACGGRGSSMEFVRADPTRTEARSGETRLNEY